MLLLGQRYRLSARNFAKLSTCGPGIKSRRCRRKRQCQFRGCASLVRRHFDRLCNKLLERGRARASAEGLTIKFQEADAEALPFGDGTFDAVVSTFGVMFTPNQDQAAAELLRVCKSGGKMVSQTGRLTALSDKYSKHLANTCRLRLV